VGQRKTTAANREHILETASRLVRERGIEHTTLSDIATASGISKGTLYYYYPTKGDLIFDIAERHMTRMTDRIFSRLQMSRPDQSPRTVFRLVLDTVMRSRSRGEIHVYLLQEAITQSPSLRQRFIEEYRNWRMIIEEGLNRILGNDEEHAIMAQVLLATLDGLILQRLVGVDAVSTDAIARFFESAGNAR
jgi:AcrR family transcriptional regulator